MKQGLVRTISLCPVLAALVWLTLSNFGAHSLAAPLNAAPPDLVFYNGVILTMEPSAPQARAIAIRKGEIIALGSNEFVLGLRKRNTRVMDLNGQSLVPGFVDAHSHVFNDAHNVGLSLEQAQALALENGITTLGDLYVTPKFLKEIIKFKRQGKLRTDHLWSVFDEATPINYGSALRLP